MKMVRILALGALALGAGSCLYAVPKLALTGPGGHSLSLSFSTPGCTSITGGQFGEAGLKCFFTKANDGDDLAGLDSLGLGSLGLVNNTSETINEVKVFDPATNFDQSFLATTNLFTHVLLSDQFPVEGSEGYIIADYFGIGNTSPGIDVFNPCAAADDPSNPCAPGQPPGFDTQSQQAGEAFVDVFFVPPPGSFAPLQSNGPLFPGLPPGATASFDASLPEPGTFGLLLSAAGLLAAARRRIHRR
jgi:hypothetical protein